MDGGGERRGREGAAVNRESPKVGYSETQIVNEASNAPGGGALAESVLRLMAAVEEQNRASKWLTGVMIALMGVQILFMAVQVWVAAVKVR
jgi:hypothetical protein